MIYPVRSRRSRGISIGVNLFPHQKVCDLDCIYCEVDNPGTSKAEPSIARLLEELVATFEAIRAGRILAGERINDIAFSGDGEPTISPLFAEAIEVAIEVRARLASPELKLVLITDALTLHRPKTRAAIDRMMANGGEIWAKLDAGTDDYFQIVCRGHVPLARPLENIRALAAMHPVVIQTMFLRVHGWPPPDEEIDEYVERVRELLASDARIGRIDLYTVARPTTEKYATALTDAELDRIAARVRLGLAPDVTVETYYSGR